jgi:hypothetical protein
MSDLQTVVAVVVKIGTYFGCIGDDGGLDFCGSILADPISIAVKVIGSALF